MLLLEGRLSDARLAQSGVHRSQVEEWKAIFVNHGTRALGSRADIDRDVLESIGPAAGAEPDEKTQGYIERLRRARSWSVAASRYRTDIDIQFICYWISLNALYGGLAGDPLKHDAPLYTLSDGDSFPVDRDLSELIHLMCRLDRHHLLKAVKSIDPQVLSDTVGDRWTSGLYWQNVYSRRPVDTRRLSSRRQRVQDALKLNQVEALLHVVLARILELRNQVVHGGASYYISKNRDSLNPAVTVLAILVPAFIEVMERNRAAATKWPPAPNPRGETPGNPDRRGR